MENERNLIDSTPHTHRANYEVVLEFESGRKYKVRHEENKNRMAFYDVKGNGWDCKFRTTDGKYENSNNTEELINKFIYSLENRRLINSDLKEFRVLE